MKQKNVLVVEDEQSSARAISIVLRREGHTVSCTDDGSDAIRRVKEAIASGDRYDLVICDLLLRGTSGLIVITIRPLQ